MIRLKYAVNVLKVILMMLFSAVNGKIVFNVFKLNIKVK